MNIAYCDCYSGISGDMFLGALIDAGLSLDELRSELSRLGLKHAYRIDVKETHKGSLRAIKFKVILTGETPEYERNLRGITEIIQNSSLPSKVIEDSIRIIQKLAEAEARVHGISVEDVHFHEVGAVDAIVDICGAVIGLNLLDIEKLYASAIPLGSGQVESAHGMIPLPAPATLELLAFGNVPTYPRQTDKELVTPTGVAILTTLGEFGRPEMVIKRIGIGAGERDLPWPNVLRIWVSEPVVQKPGSMSLIETNVDDMNPEFYGHVMNLLFQAGALDVYLTPVYMKKNRPGAILSVMAYQNDEARLARLLLCETSTFGVRVQAINRYEAGRSLVTVSTIYGDVPVKLKIIDGEAVSASPEYIVCSRLALQFGVPILNVFNAALEAGLLYIRKTH